MIKSDIIKVLTEQNGVAPTNAEIHEFLSQLQKEWKQAEQCAHQHHASVAVLDVGGMHDGAQQQTLRVYQDMALLAVDLLAGVVARRIDADPPLYLGIAGHEAVGQPIGGREPAAPQGE